MTKIEELQKYVFCVDTLLGYKFGALTIGPELK
jgi:hypothetical protein